MSRSAAPKFYAIRQARTKVIGSVPMPEGRAAWEVKVWGENIGPAKVVPVTAGVACAVNAYDQAVLVPLLYGEAS